MQQSCLPETAGKLSAVAGRFEGYEESVMRITQTLVQLRRDKKLTQRDLAELTGITQPDISRLENGRANPSLRTLCSIARGLGMKLHVDFVAPADGE
jgi:transcriptional regulator with XRE-family HTH domain